MVDVRAARGSTATPSPEETQGRYDAQVRSVAARLATEFGRRDDEVEPRVRREFARWQEARVTQFVPVFVERTVRHQLRHGTSHSQP
ncbi:MAG: hypothetical protein JWL83_3613, partial [Actinomycetia bacterium]|jgi:hypothetical protein|nr:hypothetical protein [Actinomycetes bacterium]